ncbi:hypothetical protein BH09BAC1_BH09BAC1_13990 [soil metagenome]
MRVEEILKKLPSSVSWMVMFDVAAFRTLADDVTFKAMYFLNPEIDLNLYSHAILTSQGRYVSPHEGNTLTHGETLEEYEYHSDDNLLNAYDEHLRVFDIEQSHCLAVADYPVYGKVSLYVTLGNGEARAESSFQKAPSQAHYEFLQAVGVKFLGGEQQGDRFVARYSNALPIHIHSGILNEFSRTDNCNIFFFQQGNIEEGLAAGLRTAAEKRINWLLGSARQNLIAVAEKSLTEKVSMSWLPPVGEETFPFGDLVPQGFANLALKTFPNDVQPRLEQRLRDKKLKGFWAFESNDLGTSVDSALVLQSLVDHEAAELLETFSNGEGAYVPQLWDMQSGYDEVQNASAGGAVHGYVSGKKHWGQPDIATTALIAAIRRRHNLPVREATRQFIITNFDDRSSLYYANPYLVDWVYAQALTKLEGTQHLRVKLIDEITASIDNNYSAGQFDKVLSSAFAVLALNELGYKGRFIPALQLYIVNHYHHQMQGKHVPFYSSVIHEAGGFAGRAVTVNGYNLELSLHQDTHNMIYHAAVAMALAIPRDEELPAEDLFVQINKTPHGRYLSPTVNHYVEGYALTPYMVANLPVA